MFYKSTQKCPGTRKKENAVVEETKWNFKKEKGTQNRQIMKVFMN